MKRIPGALSDVPEPFFTYFGSKHNLAGSYPPPEHDTVIEPFAGSAAYATWHYKKNVVLYDVYPVICGVWEWLIKATAEDVMRLPINVTDLTELAICQEAKWLIGFWLKKGNAYPVTIPHARMRGGLRPDSHWGSMIRARIAKNVYKIKHWKVHYKSYADAPDEVATWFIDPPYTRSGSAYKHYDVEYTQLREWTANRRGQVIACGQPGDDWVDFNMSRNIRNVVNGQSVELLYYRSDECH